MFSPLIRSALRYPFPFIGILILAVGCAIHYLRGLGFDIWPDVSPVQVQVLTQVRDLAPEEAEATITRPLELEFGGLPGLEEIRSETTFGVSQIILVFRSGTNLLQARQWSQERVQAALSRLPKGYSPVLAPPSDGLGEICTYALQPRENTGRSVVQELSYLKQIQDFVVRPALRTVPGIVEVNTTGGYDRALVVEPSLEKLYQMGLDAVDLGKAVEASVGVGGGAMLEPGDHQTIVRSRARAQTIAEIEQVPVKLSWGALAIKTGDVATVLEGTKIRFGAATLDGKEAVLGTAMMLVGANSHETARLFRNKLREIQHYLPADIQIISLYDRARVVDKILHTIATNLVLALLLVAIVLLVFFRNWRAMLITMLVIPVSFLFALSALSWFGLSGNLMSLGALDFGLIVDGAVVVVDNVLLRLSRKQGEAGGALTLVERREIVYDAACEVVPPMAVGWCIVLLAYVPSILLGGVEGRMLQPLALTALFALTAAFPLSLVLVPILSLFIKRAPPDSRIGRAATLAYLQILERAWRHRGIVMAVSVALCLFAGVVISRLGLDFFPALDEGSTVVEVEKPVQLNIEESLKWELATEAAIRRAVPEVDHVYSRIGFSDVATDPQSPNQNDIYISYRSRGKSIWTNDRRVTKQELERKILAAIRASVPRQELALSQPIRVRFDEMLEGVRSAFAIKIFSSDSRRLESLANQVKLLVEKLPGAQDVLLDPVGELPGLEFNTDRPTMARYLVSTTEVDQNISVALAGWEIGRVDEGEQYFPIILRLPEPLRNDVRQFINLPIRSAEGNLILTLGQLGKFEELPRLNLIFHENGFRRRAVMVNIEGRDLGSFAQIAKDAIRSDVKLLPGERIEFGGNYRFLEASLNELRWIVPATLVAIYLLVAISLRSWSRALIVYSGVPFALIGGIFALGFAKMSLSLSALIGLMAVTGIAVFNKLVFVHHYAKLRERNLGLKAAVIQTTKNRLRPVLCTAVVAMAGFIPMLFSTELGAEVQRPIAIVVIGGLFTSTSLTLVILPLLLLVFEKDRTKSMGTVENRRRVESLTFDRVENIHPGHERSPG